MFQFCKSCVSRISLGCLAIQETRRNAGHSKWANIKHTKALKDSQRAATFTKLGRMMRVAIQEGGGSNPNHNLRLDYLIVQAKRYNMTPTSIKNILKSAESSKDASKSAFLDFRGPGNCVIIADVLTVNLTKTRQLVLSILRKNNGAYADGTSKHMFDLKGVIEAVVPLRSCTTEVATEHAIEAGAEDVTEISAEKDDKTRFKFICATENLHSVKSKLVEVKYEICSAGTEYIPHTLVNLGDSELDAVTQLCDKLEENPDIVRLYDNIA